MANQRFLIRTHLPIERMENMGPVIVTGSIVASLILFLIGEFPWPLALVVLVLAVFMGSRAPSWRADPARLSGVLGEQRVNTALLALPDTYTLFNRLRVPNPYSSTGTTEIDLVVIGPNGVFTVEVKNNKGVVVGAGHELEWQVVKTGRSGGKYRSTMRNPVRQAKRQALSLRDYLREAGIHARVQSAVVFSNDECRVEPAGRLPVPIVPLRRLARAIETHRPKRPFTSQEPVVALLALLADLVEPVIDPKGAWDFQGYTRGI
ncbi:MAG: nuclease-related domain-containing protein, partial [Pseudomonadota bacterium]|nr:nuclease-related domain-containing protein [Pseudomonadota bacterium]